MDKKGETIIIYGIWIKKPPDLLNFTYKRSTRGSQEKIPVYFVDIQN